MILLFPIVALSQSVAKSKSKDAPSLTPTFSASGMATLTSHFIYNGLSMSNSNPAINAHLLLNMGPQFKMGFWGANISNVTNSDDNFWVQFQGVITVEFQNQLKTNFTVADHRYYTSQQRNGQTASADFVFRSKYIGKIEMNNNFEGTDSSSQHYRGGYIHRFKGPWHAAGYLGYTNEQSEQLNSFLDFQGEGLYQPMPNMKFKAGVTLTSDAGQLNGRGAFHYFFAGEFTF